MLIGEQASVVASAGYTSVVHASLVTLNSDLIDFFSLLLNAVPLTLFGGVSQSQEQIEAVFRDAIKTFE